MKEYEVIIEAMTPCGGAAHARRTIIEIEADSPVEYVKVNGRYPVKETEELENGSVIVIADAGNGYADRYTFTEI